MKEKWKQYGHTPYWVSNWGGFKKQLSARKWRFLNTAARDKRGYVKLTLTIDGKPQNMYLHKLVAELFIPNPHSLPQVNHKDGNKANCRVDNLEWCDASYNQIHAYNILGKKNAKKVVRISEDWTKFTLYPSLSEAARANATGVKEITQAAKSFEKPGGKKYRSAGCYWHFIE